MDQLGAESIDFTTIVGESGSGSLKTDIACLRIALESRDTEQRPIFDGALDFSVVTFANRAGSVLKHFNQ